MKAKEIMLVIRCHTVEDAEAIAKFVSERAEEKKMLEKVKTKTKPKTRRNENEVSRSIP